MNECLEAALRYEVLGFSVLPAHSPDFADGVVTCSCDRQRAPKKCASQGKHPRLNSWKWYQHRRATADEIRAWWARWPDANVGIVTGAVSGIVVLDVDGAAGLVSLAKLEAEHGPLPPAPTAITGAGGRHLYFKHPGHRVGNKVNLAPGLDLRGDGGFVIAPPSLHKSNRHYADDPAAPGNGKPLEGLPFLAMMEKPAAPKNEKGWALKALREGVAQGQRNDTTKKLIGHYLRKRLAIPEIVALLVDWDAKNKPPQGAAVVRQTVASVAKTVKAKATEEAAETTGGSTYHRTDAGNAECFAAKYGTRVRFVHTFKEWRVWDGMSWHPDETGEADRLALLTARARLRASADIKDPDECEAEAGWAIGSESAKRRRDLLTSASTIKEIATRPADYDQDPWAFNVANGTLDLRTADLRPHDPQEMHSKIAPVTFDSKAVCPRFDRFLLEIFDGNEALAEFLGRAVGYSLTGYTGEDAFFILFGPTSWNGKSTLLGILHKLLGDYARVVDFVTFTHSKHPQTGPRNDLARLAGARFVSASEPDAGIRFSEGLLKQLTGGDSVLARFLHKEHFEYVPELKPWISCNHKPRVQDASAAFWRRVYLLPFDVSFKGRSEKHLDKALAAELSGILNWALRGCLTWQQMDDLQAPDEVLLARETYRAEEDPLSRFLDDRTERSETEIVLVKSLYAAYLEWCTDNGEKPMAQRTMSKLLAARGLLSRRGGHDSSWRYNGIGLT